MSEFLQPYRDIIAEQRVEHVGNRIYQLLRMDAVRTVLLGRGQRGIFERNDTVEKAKNGIARAAQSELIDSFAIPSFYDPELIVGVATVIEALPLKRSRTKNLPTWIERKLRISQDVTPDGPNIFAWTHPEHVDELALAYKSLADKQRELFTPTSRIHTSAGSFDSAQVGWTVEQLPGATESSSINAFLEVSEGLSRAGFVEESFGRYDEGEYRWERSTPAKLYTLTASRPATSSEPNSSS